MDTRGINFDKRGTFTRACIAGNEEVVTYLLYELSYEPTEEGFTSACSLGRTAVVEILLVNGIIDPTHRQHEGLKKACGLGHSEVVELILSDCRVIITQSDFDLLLTIACTKGHAGVLSVLLSKTDVSRYMKTQLLNKTKREHREVMALLRTI
ncbi:Hypothetical protein POVR2_LOCUS373 [uncultured virus]|nr:Hypothetical protein POVR2_LOCUS373 [uncultured virus]